MVNLFDQTIDRKHRRTALVKVFVLVALFTTAGSSRAAAVTFPASPVAETSFDPVAVDRFITAQMARHRIPGIALAITQGDRVVHVRGYGTTHDGKPVTGQTPFRIASLSKAFTAMAVLRLVEGGRISLDTPIKQYLPSFELATPSATAKITVRQLLNHTSGLADTGFVNGLLGQEKTLADRIIPIPNKIVNNRISATYGDRHEQTCQWCVPN